jgi:hypothetical protein
MPATPNSIKKFEMPNLYMIGIITAVIIISLIFYEKVKNIQDKMDSLQTHLNHVERTSTTEINSIRTTIQSVLTNNTSPKFNNPKEELRNRRSIDVVNLLNQFEDEPAVITS